MDHVITITAEQFGRALCAYMGIKMGNIFFPYRIIRSSFTPPETMEIEMVSEVLGKETLFSLTSQLPGEGAHFRLSHEEVADALTREITLWRRIPYRGNQIRDLPEWVPDSVEIVLEYYPRGSLSKESQNRFGGL